MKTQYSILSFDLRKEIVRLEETCLEITSDKYFPSGLTFPRRPPWNFDMSRLELDSRENRYFTVNLLMTLFFNNPAVHFYYGGFFLFLGIFN
jgi:hypothetical protein